LQGLGAFHIQHGPLFAKGKDHGGNDRDGLPKMMSPQSSVALKAKPETCATSSLHEIDEQSNLVGLYP
jgi:hypothetical protein